MINQWHYECNNRKFFNKLSAIQENAQAGHPVLFREPNSYNNFPIHKEPAAGWFDLLRYRALEIRRKYKKVKLWYSGGCDSTTVLHAFIDNNILLDEIVIIKSGIAKADTEADCALSYLTKLKHKIPTTKITVQQTDYNWYNTVYSNNYWFEDMQNQSPLHFRSNHLMFDDHDDDRTANVWGHDKPFILYKNKTWWMYFIDVDFDPSMQEDTRRVNFFSDSPLIHAKQSHMLKNYIVDHVELSKWNDVVGYDNQNIWNYASGRISAPTDFFLVKTFSENTIILNDTKFYYSSLKEKNAIITLANENFDLLKKWKSSVDDFSAFADGKWFNQGRPEFGTVGIFSKFYSLDSKEVKTVDELFPFGFDRKYLD